jgi:hypothetical protein
MKDMCAFVAIEATFDDIYFGSPHSLSLSWMCQLFPTAALPASGFSTLLLGFERQRAACHPERELSQFTKSCFSYSFACISLPCFTVRSNQAW